MEFSGLYHDIVESSADGIWVFDLRGRTIYANRVIASMFGVTQDEFCRLTVFDTLDELGQRQFQEHLADVSTGRVNEHDVEVRFVRGDGTSFWALVGEGVLRDEVGEITAIVHRFADYDDRRRVLDELSESRRQLAEGQRIARIGTWEWDVREDRIVGSDGLAALYGLSRDFFPTTYELMLERVHPDDRDQVKESVETSLAEGDAFEFSARIRREDDWPWVRGRGVVERDADGEVLSVTGAVQDVTETKLAELALEDQVAQNALLQAIASAANEARTLDEVLAQARLLVLMHDDWTRARGFVPTEDCGIRPLHVSDADREDDAAAPDLAAHDLALASEAVRRGEPVWDDERLTIGFPVLYDGRVYAVITITSEPPLYRHDMIRSMADQVALQLTRVIEREHAQRALADARDEAMEASRQKSDFLATMSHEIRTPLNGVIGLNELLLRTRLDPQQLQLASGVQVAGRSLLGLINDILDFSKIEAGKLELERVDFAVRAVFDQVLSVLGEAARAKGLDLVASCSPEVPERLAGDPTRLAQVLVNLASNAIKFTEVGEVTLRATAEEHADGVRLQVEVTDTGIGIDLDDVGDLFDVFTQADVSTTRVHGGTGLGLAISREIALAMGGQIAVESVPGEGSVFRFTSDHAAATVATDPDDDHARTHLAGRRVLVVDGHAQHRELVAQQLACWQVRAEAVASAAEAEAALDAALASDPYDAVVLDLTLAGPRSNGLSCARSLRARPAFGDLAVLLVAASGELDDVFLRESGITDCLVRPLTTHALRSALVRHVAGAEPRVASAAAPAPSVGERRRVLVVEDNAVNQMVALGLLASLGYDAATAEDGVEALEVLVREDFDLVLMDVQMPRLDGYETTRAIREREPQGQRVPIVAMTAAAVEGERERCLAVGMDDFLTKPVDADVLATTLARWLNGEARPTSEVRTQAAPRNGTPSHVDGLDLTRLDMLRDLGEGDTSYLDRAIGNFVANAPDTLASIRDAVDRTDVPALQQAAHKLAGSASNLGVAEVGSVARLLEHLADAGSTEGADRLVEELTIAVGRGRAGVLAYRASYRDSSS